MTADALCELGRPDAVMERTQRYRKYLMDTPRAWNPIDANEWRAVLGDYDRAGDWVVLFERELAEAPWTEVLDRWVPRLAAGSYGSARTPCSVLRARPAPRSPPTAQRLHELAEGLGFWAARTRPCPKRSAPRALRPSAALRRSSSSRSMTVGLAPVHRAHRQARHTRFVRERHRSGRHVGRSGGVPR